MRGPIQEILALATFGGGLIFWPICRLIFGPTDVRTKRSKKLMILHIILMTSAFGMVVYYREAGYRDWLHAMILPYIAGWLTIFIGIVILILAAIFGKNKSSKKKLHEIGEDAAP